MSLKGTAKETLKILEEGQYVSPSGQTIRIKDEQDYAVKGTVLYTPEKAQEILSKTPDTSHRQKPVIEVTNEKTQVAAKRLVLTEGCSDLILLNFASARNPGGGFVNGAKAQEEDLARCSGLYPCQLTQPDYYEINRRQTSLLYTDHLIYSPKVPWFRCQNRDLLEVPYTASIITAPAPNAGQALRRDPDAWPAIEAALRRRAGMVLAVARENGHRSLLLGAWGCGVFRNKPEMVADAFGTWIESPVFHGCFEQICFAILDRSRDQETLNAFKQRFNHFA